MVKIIHNFLQVQLMHNDVQDLAGILKNIQNYLDDFNSSKIFQECKELETSVGKYSISAMIAYRLRKISQLTKSTLSDNSEFLRREIDELIKILTNFVSWQCKLCGKTIEAEDKSTIFMDKSA